MAPRHQLSPDDRDFFRLVAGATFSNPFSDEREAMDLEIVGRTGPLPRPERVKLLREVVSSRIARLEERGIADLRGHSAEDRVLLRTGFLFDLYHRYHDAFDLHILEQIDKGATACPVPFATEALDLLERRGYERDEATRLFAIVFQVRRAFYFIDRALIGRSPCMKDLRRELWNSVFTHDIRWYERYLSDRMEDFSTLILGETGSGKGTAAAAIGRSSFIPFERRKGRFVESFTSSLLAINLSQYSAMLIESELFGHRKGAFTGAIEDHDGVFARCSEHGSIFLDEIGEVSVPIQIKLLQVLQERIFMPVGGRRPHRFKGRVIAATNCPLDELRSCGQFRDDFYYRLCSHIITVPSLRQRLQEDPGELDDLLDHTLARLTGGHDEELATTVRRIIAESIPGDYPWGGNVRELEQCVRRILLTRAYRPEPGPPPDRAGQLVRAIERGSMTAQELVAAYCALLHERHGTLAEVARRTGLDRRTVRKYVEEAGRDSDLAPEVE